MVEKILKEARQWVGVQAHSKKHYQIIDEYNNTSPLPSGYKVKYSDHWCATFVSFIMHRVGLDHLTGRECSCQRFIDIFKAKGIWIEDGSITPKPGDIVLFNWDVKIQPNDGWSDHIGFVEKVDGKEVTTIEGNYNKMVTRRKYLVGNGYIRGYARPKYSVTVDDKKSTSEIAKEVIDGKWGNGVDRANRLSAAGYDPATIQKEVNKLLK